MVTLPEMPVLAAMTVCEPILQLCPIWTWLSILVVADNGVAHRAPVDVGVRADFYVVAQRYRAGLRDFEPRIAGEGESETVRADDRAAVDFDVSAECAAVINDGVGMQDDFVAQFAIVLDDGVCQDAAAFAEHGVRADVGVRADFTACGNGRARFDDGGRMDAAARFDDG